MKYQQQQRYRATFTDNHQKELLHIDDAEEAAIISRSVAILEDYRDARCVIEDGSCDREVLTLKRCGIE